MPANLLTYANVPRPHVGMNLAYNTHPMGSRAKSTRQTETSLQFLAKKDYVGTEYRGKPQAIVLEVAMPSEKHNWEFSGNLADDPYLTDIKKHLGELDDEEEPAAKPSRKKKLRAGKQRTNKRVTVSRSSAAKKARL